MESNKKYLSLFENMDEGFDITESKIQQDKLLCTIKQLTALNELKDKLFKDVIHDMRNPVAAMVSMMEVLEEDYHSSDNEEIIHEVRKQVKNTFFMVENLLEEFESQREGLSSIQTMHQV